MKTIARTTITIPKDLLKVAKVTSAAEEKTLSEFIGEALREKLSKDRSSNISDLISLAGTIEPKTEAFKDPKGYIRKLRELSDD